MASPTHRNSETLFFTADTHFGHTNILQYCKRPWHDVEAMDIGLVARWNEVVPADGVVYHLGDVAFLNTARANDLLSQLHGRIVLIAGNHDKGMSATAKARFEAVHDYHELKIDAQRIVLFHYPIENWNNIGTGAWHLYGHAHGRTPTLGRPVDVGVDSWNWRPVS